MVNIYHTSLEQTSLRHPLRNVLADNVRYLQFTLQACLQLSLALRHYKYSLYERHWAFQSQNQKLFWNFNTLQIVSRQEANTV